MNVNYENERTNVRKEDIPGLKNVSLKVISIMCQKM